MTDDVAAAVRALLPDIAARAREVDVNAAIPQETIDALDGTGVFQWLQPARYGGLEGDPVGFYRTIRELSAACGSTGWVTSVLGVHPWHLALFDRRAQDDVWGDDPHARLSSSYSPIGELTPVDGGFRLTGRWGFSSGVAHADWALLGAVVLGNGGRRVDFLTVVVPRTDYAVVDVWDPVGMRGTASNEIHIDDVFVPEHRVVRNYDVAHLDGPGRKINRGALFAMPWASMFVMAVSMPVLGVVAGSYDRFVDSMQDRVRLSLGGARFVDDGFAQVAVARASSEIDAAIVQMEHDLAELTAAARSGREIPYRLRLRVRRDQVRGVERALEAMDLLFKIAGGNTLTRGNPIERAWRDAHAGSLHVANEPERALALFGRGEFGLSIEDNMV